MPCVAESTGEENANLYERGVNEGSRGELLNASELLELLDVFGEDGEMLPRRIFGRRRRRYGGARRIVILRHARVRR